MRCTILRIRTESLPASGINSNCMGQTLWETEGLSCLVGKSAEHKRKQMDMAGERGMKLGKKRRMDVRIRFGAGSLAGELVGLLLISGITAGVVFGIFSMVVNRGLNDYFLGSSYLQRTELNMVQELQDYVLAQGIAASDQTALSEWVRKKSIVYLEIYRKDMLLFVSDTPEAENFYENMKVPYYRESYYRVMFADGEAEVFLAGAFAYRYRMYVLAASAVVCFFVFVGCFLWGVRRRILYIQDIRREIGIMESGCLDQEVPVKGRDELAQLAAGLNQMRMALRESMEREQELRRANRDLIVGLTHDLRTPFTALTTYVEIMRSGVCTDEANRDYYLDKIMTKAVQMKELSDRLFECGQVGKGGWEERGKELVLFQSVFMDCLSELVMFLEGQGFLVEVCLEWRREVIWVSMDDILRIVDNLGTNLVKYADREEAVRIAAVYEDGEVGIEVRNRIRRQEESKIGMENVKALMGNMGGRCETEMGNGAYGIRILFPAMGEILQNC